MEGEIIMSGAKKQVIFSLLFIFIVYSIWAYSGYHVIMAGAQDIEDQYEIVMSEVERGNPYIHQPIISHNELIVIYEERQRKVPTFWMPLVFNFPEYEDLHYEDLRPLIEENMAQEDSDADATEEDEDEEALEEDEEDEETQDS